MQENPNQQYIRSRSIASRFNGWLRRFALSREITKSSSALEENITRNLQGKDVTPKQKNYDGIPALFQTQDIIDAEFVEKMRACTPNGYIVGIGTGGIFSLLQCFPTGIMPKGIVMTDINPHVVAAGKVMIQELIQATDVKDFFNNFFELSDKQYQAKIKLAVLRDRALQQGLRQWKVPSIKPYTPMSSWEEIQGIITEIASGRRIPYAYTPLVIQGQFPLLQHLAKEGEIAAHYTDFRNPDFINAVVNLPEFTQSINIIYMTNMLTMENVYDQNRTTPSNPLKAYDNPSRPPIFINDSFPEQKLQISRSFEEVLQTIDVL